MLQHIRSIYTKILSRQQLRPLLLYIDDLSKHCMYCPCADVILQQLCTCFLASYLVLVHGLGS